MEDSLNEALTSLTGGDFTKMGQPSEPAAPGGVPAVGQPALEAEFQGVTEAIDRLGEDLISLEEALERLKELIGGE
jgi:predicted dehydrogenase